MGLFSQLREIYVRIEALGNWLGQKTSQLAVRQPASTQRNIRRVFLFHADHMIAGIDMVRFARDAA